MLLLHDLKGVLGILGYAVDFGLGYPCIRTYVVLTEAHNLFTMLLQLINAPRPVKPSSDIPTQLPHIFLCAKADSRMDSPIPRTVRFS